MPFNFTCKKYRASEYDKTEFQDAAAAMLQASVQIKALPFCIVGILFHCVKEFYQVIQ